MYKIIEICWQWRNFDIFICSGRHTEEQGNVKILQHLLSDRRSGASSKLFLNLMIQFYLDDATIQQFTSHSMVSFMPYDMERDHRLLWQSLQPIYDVTGCKKYKNSEN